MASSRSTRRFNWQGITDNGDGSFTTDGKRAKTRLLKEFHRQGVAVRSTKIEGDGYKIAPVGTISKRRTGRSPSLGYRPRTVYPHRISRPIYQRAPPRLGAYRGPVGSPRMPVTNRPYYAAPPRAHGPGLVSRVGGYLHRKQQEGIARHQKEIHERKERAITEEKMRQETLAREREETAAQVRKNELHAEKIEFERKQQAERLRTCMNQPQGHWQGGQVATTPSRGEEPRSESKIDHTQQLQAARTEAIENNQ